MTYSDLPISSLTPKQSKAGRALLAWSQKELANRAGIATSTVADFERGHRKPVPQNAEAIRKTFEGAGVAFLADGAVNGPSFPKLSVANNSGIPIRWVTRTDLEQWADRRDSQGSLPTLLAKIARASGASIHFPSDEDVNRSGWDGVTFAVVASEYVPEGHTGWELSTQRKVKEKANEDYKSRTENPLHLVPAQTTYICVTLRHWPDKEKWAADKRANKIWRDVRAYDGTDLVHWIELYPAVGQWLAVSLGKRPSGVWQLEKFWLEWSLATQPPLTPELILSDRDEDAVTVLRWLRESPSSLALQGETPEEVASFFFATVNQLPVEVAEHYLARCLVVGTADAARELSDNTTPLVIVAFEPDPGLVQSITQRGHYILAAYGQACTNQNKARKLARPSREGIEIALNNMGLSEIKSRNFARDSAGSFAVLRRLMPQMPGRAPKWAQDAPPRSLLAAMLAGSWDENSAGDKSLMSQLMELPYDDFVASISSYVSDFDSPLRKVGSIWKVASPQDMWLQLSCYLSHGDIDRFEKAIIDVLGAADPRYKMEPDERWYAPLMGVKPTYSECLRHGLGETLILLALFGSYVKLVVDASERPERVIRKLLCNADAQRWWSLSKDFKLLAEAAPAAFFSTVEDSLDQNNPPIAALFGKNDDPIFGTEYISNLLWALESLAWSHDFLGGIATLLARLDEIDTGESRFLNRPANSLRTIFLLWSPQTNANLSERLRVLDMLRERQPKSAWKLMLGILPSGHDSFSPTPSPRWRDFSRDKVEVITYEIIHKGGTEVVKRLLEDVGIDAERWINLLKRWRDLGQNRIEAMQRLKQVAEQVHDKAAKAMLWREIRSVLYHNRYFSDAEWALPETELAELGAAYEVFTPTDPIEKVSWLFAPGATLPDPVRPMHDSAKVDQWKLNVELCQTEQSSAAKQILDEQGLDGFFELSGAVQCPFLLGEAIARDITDRSSYDKVLHRALKSSNDCDHELARAMISSLWIKNDKPWTNNLIAQAMREAWGEKAILTILLALPSKAATWSLASKSGVSTETAYWNHISVFNTDDDDANAFVLEKLISVGRAQDGVHFAGLKLHQHKKLPAELLVSMLREAARQPVREDISNNDRVMFQHYVTEVLQVLHKEANITTEVMLELEWIYLPLFDHSQRPAKVIMNELASNPELFIQLIKAIYNSAEENGTQDITQENVEHEQKIAMQASRLLIVWNTMPGADAKGTIDEAKLETWVKEARKLAHASGRGKIADQKIGEILSASMIDTDGIWPARPIRDLIEIVKSRDLEAGFFIGRWNRRGMTSRLPRDGGKQEEDLAKTYRGWSKSTALEWPRVSNVLEKLAKKYQQEAREHDERAIQLDW